MQIYPSILETDVKSFNEQLDRVLPFFSHFQIDIADGLFVPNKTVQIEEITEHRTWSMEHGALISTKTFEFHLMVEDYITEIEKLKLLRKVINIRTVLIHKKSLPLDPSTPQPFAKGWVAQDDKGWNYGLVLNPEDDITTNWQVIKQFPIVQIMTVNPGFQGTPFLPETLDKIDELKHLGFTGKIILDGGINDKTLPLIMRRKFLPQAICPGSYFKTNVAKRLSLLKQICE